MGLFQVRFGSPRHGSLLVRFGGDSTSVEHSVSDVRSDSLAELLTALLSVAAGSIEGEVRWYLEPEEWVWRLARVPAERGSEPKEEGAPAGEDWMVASAKVSAWDHTAIRLPSRILLKRMVEGLDLLAADPVWRKESTGTHSLDAAWAWPFPNQALAELKALIRS